MNDFEKSLLGLCIVTPRHFIAVAEALRADHFTPQARAIFLAMRSLLERGDSIDLVTVKNQLVATGTLDAAGGIANVAGLSDAGLVPHTEASVESWIDGVREAGRRRRLIYEASRVSELTLDPTQTVDGLLSQFQALALGLDFEASEGTSFNPQALYRAGVKAAEEICDARDGVIGIPSGLADLDALTGGWRPGQYIAIGARPSVGKSSLALQMADHAANLGHTVAFFSLEMEAAELALVRACAEARISKFELQMSGGGGDRLSRMTAAFGRQSKTPLFVEKLYAPGVGPIQARAARIKAEHGLGLVVIDYIQLMRGEGKNGNRNEELTLISSGLKTMASRLGAPVIVCAQLSRQAAAENQPPRLNHFRDSGSIEADADVAILLHRCVEGADRTLPVAVDLMVEKNRTGSCGVVPTTFVGKYQRFMERIEGE